jgi:O-antigen/teichoic acid export membrane protein
MHARIAAFSKIPFVRDVATMQIGRLITVGGGFLTSILYVRYLSLDGYGEYAIVLAFAGTFGIFTNLGQQATLTTFLAESYGRKDRQAMTSIAQYYLVVSLLVVVLLSTLTLLAPSITAYVYDDTAIGKLAQLVFLSSMFEFAFSYYAICLQVVREIRLLTLLENSKSVVQIGLSIVLLLLGYGVAGVLLGSLVTSLLYCLLSFFCYSRFQKKYNLPSIREIINIRTFHHCWKYVKDGIWIALDKNAGNLYPTVFLFALSTQAPKPVVGLLRLAFKLADLPASFALNSVSRLGTSVLSTLAGEGGARLRTSFTRLVKHTVLMHTGITLAGMLIIPFLLPIVYGQNFRVAVYPFLIITALQLGYGLTTSATPILRVYSKIYLATLINVSAMILALSTFFFMQRTLPSTQALYLGLLLYHAVLSTVMLPLGIFSTKNNDKAENTKISSHSTQGTASKHTAYTWKDT